MPIGPGGGSGGGATNEVPTGAINGVNQDFVFSAAPVAVFFQGVLQEEGIDYTVSGSTITFAVAPVSGVVKGLV